MAIAAHTAHPWRCEPVIRPSVYVRPADMRRSKTVRSDSTSGVGFSNGWALLALKKPPPFVPNSLMISCEATGPCAIVCSVTVVRHRFCHLRPLSELAVARPELPLS